MKHLLVNGGPGLRGIDSFTGAQMLEEFNDSTSSTCSGAWMSYTDGYTVTVHSRERNEMLAEMIGKPSGKMGALLAWTDLAVEKGKSRAREGNTVCEVRYGHGVSSGGEGSGLTGEDSSHGRIRADEIV